MNTTTLPTFEVRALEGKKTPKYLNTLGIEVTATLQGQTLASEIWAKEDATKAAQSWARKLKIKVGVFQVRQVAEFTTNEKADFDF